MSNYTITTDFGAKDSLPSSNDSKVVRGSEFTTEFTSIQTAIATKADTAGDTFTGVVNFSADVAVNTNTLFVDVSEAKVGIGTSSPDQKLQVDGNIRLGDTATGVDDDEDYGLRTGGSLTLHANDSGNNTFNTALAFDVGNASGAQAASSKIQFKVNNTERMRIDASGNVLVGKTSADNTTQGIRLLGSEGFASFVRDGAEPIVVNRLTSDGNLVELRKDSSTTPVGTIGTVSGDIRIGGGDNNHAGIRFAASTKAVIPVKNTDGDLSDNNTDLGASNSRFKDLHLSGSGYFGGNVGIGTSSPSSNLHVFKGESGGATPNSQSSLVLENNSNTYLQFLTPATNESGMLFGDNDNDRGGLTYNHSSDFMAFRANAAERMRIDSSGNLLVGKTSSAFNTVGVELLPTGRVYATATSTAPMYSNRKSTDGSIMDFAKDGTTVGSIGNQSARPYFASTDCGIRLGGADLLPATSAGSVSDNVVSLGSSSGRWKDLYLSGSTYSTSDRNKKQDIRDLTDAEARVATVAKGSLKAFRYIDSVEAEGDEANIHFGIIAQDLKAAFEAEGLNATDYQVFKTSTYTDDDGVEQTTYSICYENLLAFIITAI